MNKMSVLKTQTDYSYKYRFFSFGEYLKQQFPFKVHKIALHAGFTCQIGMGGPEWADVRIARMKVLVQM